MRNKIQLNDIYLRYIGRDLCEKSPFNFKREKMSWFLKKAQLFPKIERADTTMNEWEKSYSNKIKFASNESQNKMQNKKIVNP